VRIGAIFIALCMVLIAASLGAVLFVRFGFSVVDSAVAALGLLTCLPSITLSPDADAIGLS